MFNRYRSPDAGRRPGELRWEETVYTKGDKITKRSKELRVWNGYYWDEVPTQAFFYDAD